MCSGMDIPYVPSFLDYVSRGLGWFTYNIFVFFLIPLLPLSFSYFIFRLTDVSLNGVVKFYVWVSSMAHQYFPSGKQKAIEQGTRVVCVLSCVGHTCSYFVFTVATKWNFVNYIL